MTLLSVYESICNEIQYLLRDYRHTNIVPSIRQDSDFIVHTNDSANAVKEFKKVEDGNNVIIIVFFNFLYSQQRFVLSNCILLYSIL